MKKINIVIILIFLFLITTNVSALEINSKYALLYNLEDNSVVYSKNKDEKTSIASLTKIMTLLVAIENIDNYQEEIIIKKEMFDSLNGTGAYVIGLTDGMKLTYNDLLYGMFLTSGADATMAIATSIASSKENFVKLMNKKAEDLGLKNTSFENPIGLDSNNHYSTVNDVAILLKEALKNKKFKKIYETKSYTFKNYDITVKNSFRKSATKYNIDDSYILGAKTGYTGDSLYSLSTTAIDKKNNINYLLITTNADSIEEYLKDATNIYNYYFKNYKYYNLINKGELLVTLKTKYATKDKINIYAKKDIKHYLKNDFSKDKIKYKYKGIKVLNPSIKKNEKIGSLDILYNNKKIDTIDILLSDTIKFSLINYLITNYKLSIVILISIIIIIYLRVKFKNKKKLFKK